MPLQAADRLGCMVRQHGETVACGGTVTTAPTNTGRAASAVGHHRKIVPRRRTPGGLFTAEHAYAVRLVQIARATADPGSPAEFEAGNKTAAGIVPRAAHENAG